MGWGDELIVTGQVRELAARTGKRVRIVYERAGRWHEAFEHNPRIAQRGEKGDFAELVPRDDWRRPYCAHKGADRWTWRRYRPPRGELWFTPQEQAFGALHAGRVVLEPHIKAGASPNKQWGWIRWNKLAWLIRERLGITPTQIGLGTSELLDGAEHIGTSSMRLAAALISRARAIVVPEGGLHHVAAAVGTPAVVIFGGYIAPEVTGYPEQRSFFRATQHYPLGCGYRIPCEHCKVSMAAIAPEDVFKALEEALANGKRDRAQDGHQGMAGAVAAGG